MAVDILAITEEHWRQVRDLRLQALADTPHAFMETFLHAAEQRDDEWRQRARRCEGPGYVGYAAVDTTNSRGLWVGTMRCELTPDHTALLLGVFVAASHRGRAQGVADGLLDAVENWAARHHLPDIYLDVHQDNARAQAFYRRRGYRFTGVRQPYPLNTQQYELQMHLAR